MPFLQDWVAIAERIDCPAPLPEDPESDLLTKMLFPAPYEVPEKKAKNKAVGTREGLWRKVASNMMSDDTKTPSSSSPLVEECVSVSSDVTSDATLHRRPFLVPAALFLAFFSGTS